MASTYIASSRAPPRRSVIFCSIFAKRRIVQSALSALDKAAADFDRGVGKSLKTPLNRRHPRVLKGASISVSIPRILFITVWLLPFLGCCDADALRFDGESK